MYDCIKTSSDAALQEPLLVPRSTMTLLNDQITAAQWSEAVETAKNLLTSLQQHCDRFESGLGKTRRVDARLIASSACGVGR